MLLWVFAGASTAHAHGGRPQTYDVLFAPDDDDTILVPASFGTLISEDGGASFSLLCLDAMPDPRPGSIRPFAFTPLGTILVAQEFGLVRGPDHGCGFSYVDAEPRDAFIADVVPYGEDVLVLRSDASVENQVFVTRADGTTLEALPARFATDFLPERLRVAPSDPLRWWVSGTSRREGTTFLDGRVYVSDDGGASYVSHAFPLELDERRLRVVAIDPADPDHVIAVVHALAEDRPIEIHLDADGLATRRLPAMPGDPMRIDRVFAAAFLPDGTVWLGNDLGGLLSLGTDGAIEVIDKNLALGCLVVHGEDVYLCADDYPDETGDGFAVARQTIGAPYAPVAVLTYEAIVGPAACGHASDATCAMRWPETLIDLGRASPLDAGLEDAGALDAGTVAPHDADLDAPRPIVDVGSLALDAGHGGGGSCACRVSPRDTPGRRHLALVVGLSLVLLAVRRRGERFPSRENPRKASFSRSGRSVMLDG